MKLVKFPLLNRKHDKDGNIVMERIEGYVNAEQVQGIYADPDPDFTSQVNSTNQTEEDGTLKYVKIGEKSRTYADVAGKLYFIDLKLETVKNRLEANK